MPVDEIIAPPPVVKPFALMRRMPAAVVALFAVKVSRFPVVVMTPEKFMSIPVPVVVAVSVTKMRVAASAAVELRSTSVPFVAPPVSIEVELMRSIEPPSAITEVVWLRMRP